MRLLKCWNRGLERDGNLCPWRYSDIDWSSLGAACSEMAWVGAETFMRLHRLALHPGLGRRSFLELGVAGGNPTLTTQVGQARVGTGTLATPSLPYCSSESGCSILVFRCCKRVSLHHGLDLCMAPMSWRPPCLLVLIFILLLLQHFAPRWCNVLSVSI